ncbi:MAG: mechanosensitive ion channel family protein [Opitutales bacterium]
MIENLHLKTELWGNTVLQYLLTLGGAVTVAMVLWAALQLLGRRLHRLNRDRNLAVFLVVRALGAVRFWLILLAVGVVFIQRLALVETSYPWLKAAFVLFVVLQVMISVNRALGAWGERYKPEELADRAAQHTTMKMLLFFGRLFLFTLGILIIIDNLPGVQITALVASLGIGGIAVALALQNILSDIFASLTITLDKPFILGDFIMVGDHLGAVENIGLKTTRIRSLSGEQLIFSNNDLLTSRIRNFKRMEQRRVVYKITVTYDTPPEKLRAIPSKIKEIIEAQPNTRFDRAHFVQHADYALVYEIVYYVGSPDYNLYMDCQQAINLATHEYFLEQGIEFAFPTQTVYHRQDDPQIAASLRAVTAAPASEEPPAEARQAD